MAKISVYMVWLGKKSVSTFVTLDKALAIQEEYKAIGKRVDIFRCY